MDSPYFATAIIPTLAEEARSSSLFRAIESLRKATSRRLQIIVVINGRKYSDDVVKGLSGMGDIELIQVETGSLPMALHEGRKAVRSPYFCFLDDDDEYLPGAIDRRAEMIIREPVDLVISNGYKYVDAGDFPAFQSLQDVPREPLEALMSANWLASCSGLFRTVSVGSEFFEDIHPYMEWTWLAFRLALARMRIGVLDEPTFRIFDSPASASKSLAFAKSPITLFKRMLACVPEGKIASQIRSKLMSAWHALSGYYAYEGANVLAIECHLKSLSHRSGWRYLGATGPLLLGIIRGTIRDSGVWQSRRR